ncbi:MAG: nicotinamide riboside transporter PnuC [Leptospira sp.]|nr:nicotinamide riboside transporter PnuC [Leptospira sp.]
MEIIKSYLSLDFIIFEILNYPVSLLEFIGIISGLICVYTAAKNQIITWPIGIINSVCFLFLFYQVQLYSDMILQIYFFASSIYGWIFWQKRKGKEIPITSASQKVFIYLILIIIISSYLLGEFTLRLPIFFPVYFPLPPAFPYFDAFTTTASVVANFLLARRILQAWYLWVAVDVVCIVIYFMKGIDLIAIEYIVFLMIAIQGIRHWNAEFKLQHSV